MTKLTDMQLVLLSTAAARADGSLLPPAESLGRYGDRIRRSVGSLIKKTFAIEVPVTDKTQSWREDTEQLYGVSITDLGRATIGSDEALVAVVEAAAANPSTDQPAEASNPITPREGSKASIVVALIQRKQGATLTELVEATGWLPHTTRAALTGLRKKGHVIAKGNRDDVTCYRIEAAH